MDFKKKRLNKALEEKIYRVKMVHGKKGWITVGMTFIALFGASMLTKNVDASAVNNVAVANSANSDFVQLYNSVTKTSMHKANRGLKNGTAWKTAKAVKGIDGETYILVGGNEYANANQMDLKDETSKQNLSGVVSVGDGNGTYVQIYSNPLDGAKLVKNRALAKDTAWKTDTKVTVNGVTYYRVATNEWVKGSDATLTSENSRSDKTYIKNAPDAATTTDNNSTNTNTGSNTGNTDQEFVPDVQSSFIWTQYVDENSKEIHDKTWDMKRIGETKVTAPSIDGYTPVTPIQTVSIKEEALGQSHKDDSAQVITLVYKKGSTPATGKTAPITLKFVDENNKEIAPDKVSQQTVGSEYLTNAPAITGYTLADHSQIGMITSVNPDGNTITFTYTSKDGATIVNPADKTANMTVMYRDSNRLRLASDKVLTRPIGSTVTEKAIDIPGYKLSSWQGSTETGKVYDWGGTMEFMYTRIPDARKASAIVKYVDQDGKEIKKQDILPMHEVGYVYTAKAPEIAGYTLNGDAEQMFATGMKGDNTITFKYNKKSTSTDTEKVNVTVKYVDENGKEIEGHPADDLGKKELDKPITETAPTIDGYDLKGDATQTFTPGKKGDNTITFSYVKKTTTTPVVDKANITVKSVDENNNPIGKDVVVSDKEVGKTATIDAPEHEGYELVSNTGKTQNVTVSKDGNTVTFVYKQVSEKKMVKVTVQAIDDDTDYVIGGADNREYEAGKEVSVEAPEKWGYDLIGPSTEKMTFSGKKYDNTNATFKYKRNAVKTAALIKQLNAELFKVENEYRASHGVAPLKLDSNLQAGAEERAKQVVYEFDKMDTSMNHQQPDGSSFSEEPNLKKYSEENGPTGENIGWGGYYEDDLNKWALEMHNNIVSDQAHSDNALDSAYKAGGFGVGISENGTMFTVQDFGQ
ncbi:MucBP domain-containing protein [Companilactobacillus hulinensis]|uniref:MucBP domain-containing protein n=1 Tax=Companilactobacillus hulinensis TaxID=2486007 RepID=UPI0013DE5EA3|nr:MucBP domain-containing protein [Companilactobacillus hulinensis]